MFRFLYINGAIVQLGERLHGMQEVVSSSLISSIFLCSKDAGRDFLFPVVTVHPFGELLFPVRLPGRMDNFAT